MSHCFSKTDGQENQGNFQKVFKLQHVNEVINTQKLICIENLNLPKVQVF